MRPENLNVYRIVTNPYPSPLYAAVTDWFNRAGVKPLRLITCNNMSVIVRLVAGGAGVGILPIPIVKRELSDGELNILSVRPALPRSSVFAGYPSGRELGVAGAMVVSQDVV